MEFRKDYEEGKEKVKEAGRDVEEKFKEMKEDL